MIVKYLDEFTVVNYKDLTIRSAKYVDVIWKKFNSRKDLDYYIMVHFKSNNQATNEVLQLLFTSKIY